MHHEIRFVFGNGNDTAVVEFDGNAVRMSNDLAIFIYNSIIDTAVESSAKTIEKSLSEFIHLMIDGKIIIRLKRKEDGDITEASIIFDELDESDRKILEQGGDE